MAYGYWPEYVPVAKRRQQAQKKINQMRKKGIKIYPVNIEGRKITRTFWGNAWCQQIESFSDYANRLPRGRTYVRNGSVCHLSLEGGKINSLVSGSNLYNIEGSIKPLPKKSWQNLKNQCSGQIGSLLELLQGKLSNNIMSIVTDPVHGLFPSPKEIKLNCNCPDWAGLCKHLAAVLYGIGARLDESPELLFSLRGVDYNELIAEDIQIPSKTSRRRITSDISDVFGIELSQSMEEDIDSNQELSGKKLKRKAAPTKSKKVTTKKKVIKRTADKKASTKKAVVKKTVVSKVGTKKAAPKRATSSAVATKNNFKATGASVRRLRKQLDMNKTQFAQLVGVSSTTISNWESKNGKLSLSEASLKALKATSRLSVKGAWKKLN